jgi:hypothetical protein
LIYLYSTIHTLEILENKSTFNPVSITKGIARERKEEKQTNIITGRPGSLMTKRLNKLS